MSFSSSFKANKKKVITGFIVVVAWIILLKIYMFTTTCIQCSAPYGICKDFSYLTPFSVCHCCFPIKEVINSWIFIILPGALYYIGSSLIEFYNEINK